MVARSPNATHKRNGWSIVAHRVVRVINFRNNFCRRHFTSVTLKQGLWSLSCTCFKTSYHEISRVSWTLKAARLLCLKILQSSTFENMTDMAWHHCCCATCQISKWLENLKYQFHAFCYWLKINNTLRYCCFIVISDHILYRPPKGYTDHLAIHRGWSVGRPRICDFGKH